MISTTRVPRRLAGFTLIEMLIVLGVLGIMFAFAAPSLNGYLQQLRFREGVRTFSEHLLQARDTASKDSLTVRVHASGAELTWYDADSDALLGRTELPNNTALESSVTVLLSGRGLPLQQARFDLSDGHRSSSVWLLPTGAILR